MTSKFVFDANLYSDVLEHARERPPAICGLPTVPVQKSRLPSLSSSYSSLSSALVRDFNTPNDIPYLRTSLSLVLEVKKAVAQLFGSRRLFQNPNYKVQPL